MVWVGHCRFATKIGWDGALRDWAAAGGSGTGVLGLHVPSKGRVAGKKRPAADPSKPPKAKVAKTSKSEAKKGQVGGTGEGGSPAAGAHGEEGNVPRGDGDEANGKEKKSEAAGAKKKSFAGKIVVKHPKNPESGDMGESPAGAGRVNLNVRQVDVAVAGSKSSMNGGRSGLGVGTGGGSTTAAGQKMGSKPSIKFSLTGLATNPGSGSGRGGGSSNAGGRSSSSADGGVRGGSGGMDASRGRGIDLHESSDDDVTIVGVSAGRRGEAGRSGGAGAGLGRFKRAVEEARAGASGGYEAGVEHELMSRLSGSSGADLLSEVQWAPAGGDWAVGPMNEDMDFSADAGLLSFAVSGRQKHAGWGSSPAGQAGAGRGMVRGLSSASVGRVQASGRGGSEREQRGQTPAWMMRTQQQGAGVSNHARSEVSSPVLRLGGSGPVRLGVDPEASVMSQVQSRGVSSSSRVGVGRSDGSLGSVGAQEAYQGASALGVGARPLASTGSPGFGLSLGLGSRDDRLARDLPPQS